MKPSSKNDRSEYRAAASRLRALLGQGVLLEGSLCRVKTKAGAHWQLTRKERGKTTTLYIPGRAGAARSFCLRRAPTTHCRPFPAGGGKGVVCLLAFVFTPSSVAATSPSYPTILAILAFGISGAAVSACKGEETG